MIDPAVYPYFDIYPSQYIDSNGPSQVDSYSARLEATYPTFNLCRLAFGIAPPAYTHIFCQTLLFTLTSISTQAISLHREVGLICRRPRAPSRPSRLHLNIQCSVYVCQIRTYTSALLTMPVLTDPAVYPFFDLYPQWCTTCNEKQGEKQGELITSISTKLRARYPALNICRSNIRNTKFRY